MLMCSRMWSNVMLSPVLRMHIRVTVCLRSVLCVPYLILRLYLKIRTKTTHRYTDPKFRHVTNIRRLAVFPKGVSLFQKMSRAGQ